MPFPKMFIRMKWGMLQSIRTTKVKAGAQGYAKWRCYSRGTMVSLLQRAQHPCSRGFFLASASNGLEWCGRGCRTITTRKSRTFIYLFDRVSAAPTISLHIGRAAASGKASFRKISSVNGGYGPRFPLQERTARLAGASLSVGVGLKYIPTPIDHIARLGCDADACARPDHAILSVLVAFRLEFPSISRPLICGASWTDCLENCNSAYCSS